MVKRGTGDRADRPVGQIWCEERRQHHKGSRSQDQADHSQGLLGNLRAVTRRVSFLAPTTANYVRYWGLTGHPMSAFRNRCNFWPVMSAFGGKADSLAHLSECLLIATSGHSRVFHRHRFSDPWSVAYWVKEREIGTQACRHSCRRCGRLHAPHGRRRSGDAECLKTHETGYHNIVLKGTLTAVHETLSEVLI